ncbi:hypothetical protein A3844_22640 [Paenibacillus helianthi]|uniref:Uncharacterized protein n=1 Tax=Paenibacillus helianthi TaxID=1349432 RepID=A0ABX3EI05_9BACL|nr:hypothetical protein [Paenibacillus helianthi]OKP83256.1 hypothetical protein A3844_22640 [Paenibacillus helianthi]
MKLLKKNVIIAIIAIAGIIVYGIYYFMSLTTTMDKAVLNKLNQTGVTLQIIRLPLTTDSAPSKEVNITDQNQISNVFKYMSNLKLKKISNFKKLDATSEYDVFIYSKDNHKILFRVAFLSDKYVYVYDKNNKETIQNYSITSDFDFKSFSDMLEQSLNSQ